jgi:hypothetical protein
MKFTNNRTELEVILSIADRACTIDNTISKTTMIMDIDACHCNGNPLKLVELLQADKFDFAHDVFGIHRHINRKTGILGHCFLPRYSI